MRLSEKTIEVNFCSQLTPLIRPRPWWFGLTQQQEAGAGWDVASKISGRWVRFQLKASERRMGSTGCRRFQTPHHQLVELKARATKPGRVFYVLPNIGSTKDLVRERFDLLPSLWLLDLYDVPAIGPPTTASGALRKNEHHYLDLSVSGDWGIVTIHSDPIEVPMLGVEAVAQRIADGGEPSPDVVEPLEDQGVAPVRRFLQAGRNRVAAFLLDDG